MAAVPSGASTGKFEALELRDEDRLLTIESELEDAGIYQDSNPYPGIFK